MSDYTELLELFKQRRRAFVEQLEHDDEFTTAARLADVQLCIQAIEAVIAEPRVEKTGPKVEFGPDGWPVTLTP
ncbi:hypothetical protein ACC718_19585 [Rhizobium ruizarguesonis]